MFAREVIEKVGELENEKMKTEKAFHDFLPKCVVKDIKRKKVSDKSTNTNNHKSLLHRFQQRNFPV